MKTIVTSLFLILNLTLSQSGFADSPRLCEAPENIVVSSIFGEWRIDALLSERLLDKSVGDEVLYFDYIFEKDNSVLELEEFSDISLPKGNCVYVGGRFTLRWKMDLLTSFPFILLGKNGSTEMIGVRKNTIPSQISSLLMLAKARMRANDILFVKEKSDLGMLALRRK